MGISEAFNSLRWRLARMHADHRQSEAIDKADWTAADRHIDDMSNVDLLRALSDEEARI